MLRAHPELAARTIHTAAIVGDDAAVRRFVAQDPLSATTKGGPRRWDALTYLCFSRYLRLDRSRSDGFVSAATALLDAGADPNTGWTEEAEGSPPVWESAMYGAAGVAHHAALTRLLLDRGADPNDDETPYHTPETLDNGAMKAIVESGRLTGENLAAMLLRKADWHDGDGVAWLLERGADPNRFTRWGKTAFHQSVQRDNALVIIETMLDHGADATLRWDGSSVAGLAARRGRRDVLDAFARRGVPIELDGLERLLAACARDDSAAIREAIDGDPGLVGALVARGARPLSAFAGNGNTSGVRRLLDLGVPADAVFEEGDAYFDIAKNSTALHVAAWRGWPETVKLLVERGVAVEAPDGQGRTPLALAVRACVDSYWTHRRTPDAVELLLRAGASAASARFPSGYAAVDALLEAHRQGGDRAARSES